MNYAPTVTYQPLLETLERVFSLGGAALLSVGVMTLFVGLVSGRITKDTKPVFVSVISVAFVGVIFSVAGIVMTNSSEYQAISPQRDANLVSNLKAKYLVTDVDFNNDDYKKFLDDNRVLPLDSAYDREQLIIISLKDNEKAVFRLTQDVTTSEPTLIDLPIQTSKASVADLTRK